MPITIKNSAGGGVTLDSTTSSNETLQLPSGGGTLAPLASPVFTGNVGIGTSSPNYMLDVNGLASVTALYKHSAHNASFTIANRAAQPLVFGTDDTERMRIDSSGNVLVGQTSVNTANNGHSFGSNGNYAHHTSTESTTLISNRNTSDGDIVRLRKDNVAVGSIGTYNGDIYIGTTNGSYQSYLAFAYGGNSIIPATSSGTVNDNALHLGHNNSRFNDIWATNGTIQTSDRNEKQDILAITTAESNVATACKGLLRSFRWKDAVAEKGDDARIHFGIIAQDLQDAFTAEGLDAGRYAMFISSTWWETQTEVPAVLAVDEVTDEDGNVTTEAVEAKDAYTRTDTFETLAEAPADATERTRLGVRYPELLSFIIAAI